MQFKFDLTRTIRYDDLQDLVANMCTKEPIINFSIFKTNTKLSRGKEDIWFVDIPDIESNTPVIIGDVQFTTDYWRVTDVPLYSPIIKDPTWRDIINIFNNMLQNGDRQGIYLEGMHRLKTEDVNIVPIKFAIGS